MRKLIVPIFVLAAGASLLACAAERPPASDHYNPRSVLSGDDAADVPADPDPETDAGAEAAISEDGSAPEASSPDASPDAPVESGPVVGDPEAICAPDVVIGAGTLLPISTSADDVGLSVTPDGLSAAWTTALGDVITIHYVDRSTTSAAFGPEQIVTGAYGSRRVALRSDGLGLAAVNADGLGFSYLERAERTEAFGAPSVGPFALLATQGADELGPAGERFDNPVFARHDMFLLYTRVGAASSRTFVSTRFSSTAPFAGGAPFAEEALGSGRRIVTGASEDVRSLFVWDEVAEKSRLVTLNASSLVVGNVELGAMRDVQPSADCKTFWFGREGDLFRHSLP